MFTCCTIPLGSDFIQIYLMCPKTLFQLLRPHISKASLLLHVKAGVSSDVEIERTTCSFRPECSSLYCNRSNSYSCWRFCAVVILHAAKSCVRSVMCATCSEWSALLCFDCSKLILACWFLVAGADCRMVQAAQKLGKHGFGV